MISYIITENGYRDYFKGERDRTAYSYSFLHFGHYKEEATDNQLSKLQAAIFHLEFKGKHTLMMCVEMVSY